MSRPTTTTKAYLRIGQIAERSGVSAKALRLYEQRDLLKPCTHSEAGYRLYGPDALRRLMQIVVLKRSGFTLAEIAGMLSSKAPLIAALLGERIEALQREVTDKTRALQTLRSIADRMDSASTLDLDQLLESITMTSKLDMNFTEAEREGFRQRAEKFREHLTPEEHEGFRQRAEQLGEAGMASAQREWPELIARVRAAMDAGTPANDPAIAELARRWHALVTASTGGDPTVVKKLREVYMKQPEFMASQGLDPAMFGYMREAMAAAGLSLMR
ncbi:MAG TPA: MerR family transcriptional regulator [Xanthomonadaceae bacterium]|jgi:DNA-binding transcriptional MerR regulator|nr:MerR family transcriptional regulator [Xanthomonadaceae bacterium]